MSDKENNIKTTDNDNPQQKPRYVNGEKYQYNRFEDTFGDAGRYSDETPRKRIFLNKSHWKFTLIIGIAITMLSVALVILSVLGYI